jgi:hypothetical protein
MEGSRQKQQHTGLHPPELDVRTALRDVVQHIAPGCSRDATSRLFHRAWAILLDRDAADTAQVCAHCSSSNNAMRYVPPACALFLMASRLTLALLTHSASSY